MNTPANINKRPIGLKDLRHISVLSAASCSADGRYIAYISTKVIWEQNIHKDFITICDISTGIELKVLEGSSPRWSPVTNELGYISDDNNQTSVWIYALTDDSARCVAPVYESHYFMGHLALKNFVWSPDGSTIAYISSKESNDRNEENAEIKIINRLLYKSKGGRGRPVIADNNLSHIWIIASKGGAPRLITDSIYNEHSICWSPDSSKIAFVSNRSADPDNNQLHDLWSIDLISGTTKRHTENFGTVFQPTWSPDGRNIAFLATKGKIATNDSPAEDTQLYLVSLDNNSFQNLTASFDRRIEQLSWHPDSRSIYFTAGNMGITAIYMVVIANAKIEKIIGENGRVLEYSINTNGDAICFVSTGSSQLTEIFLHDNVNHITRKITNNSDALLGVCRLQNPEPFWFKSFDGTDIQGWVIQPANFDPQQKYPLVLVIHGGPHNMFGPEFEDRMQILAARGYGVLFINPRGSSGYGQAFSNGTLLNWGGADFRDLMAGVDAAIINNTWIDNDRLGVTGQSYGGFMTNWIITQTNRFKAAVSDGGISNLISFAGTSLYHSLIESEFNGSAYDNFDLLWEWSPLRNIKNVLTPTLILHGELDNEVPLSQAEEMYIALKKLGIETNFVQYAGEGHGWRPDLKPHNQHDRLERTIGWFDQYLNKK
ncbi:MAG: S9 family peptidase [Chitinophagaceae bacterium]|nr:MAG: S9 family peptidase [Chitinophagaceae bacterium]